MIMKEQNNHSEVFALYFYVHSSPKQKKILENGIALSVCLVKPQETKEYPMLCEHLLS